MMDDEQGSSSLPPRRGRPKKDGARRYKNGKIAYSKKRRIEEESSDETQRSDAEGQGDDEPTSSIVFEEELEDEEGDTHGSGWQDRHENREGANAEIVSAIREMHRSLQGLQKDRSGVGGADREEPKEPKIVKIRRLKEYAKRLEHVLPEHLSKEIEKCDRKKDADLDSLTDEVKYAVYSHTQGGLIRDMVGATMGPLEALTGAEGLKEAFMSDPAIAILLEEVSIKYQRYMYVEPEWRLGLCAINHAVALRDRAKARQKKPDWTHFLNSVVNPDLVQEYSDI